MGIKVVNLNYKNLFNDLNFEIEKNEITSIVGKNGSGKTALFNLLFGYDSNFKGKILFGKKDLNKLRSDIFYLTQDYYNQLFSTNVMEDIKFVKSNYENKELNEFLNEFNLSEEILKRNFSDLSESEIKKILLIMSFISDRKILFLDDPTSGLDNKAVSTLIKILKKEKRKEKIIVVASQDSEFLLKISDKLLILDNGTITEENNKYEFFQNQISINNTGLTVPAVLEFRERALKKKKIKLMHRDNINDLIKDVYRNAR